MYLASSYVAGCADDEGHDCPSDEDDHEADSGRGDYLLGGVYLIFVSTGGEPDEATVQDHYYGDEAEEAEDEGDNVKDGLLQVSGTEAEGTPDVLDGDRCRRDCRDGKYPEGSCTGDKFAVEFHTSTPFLFIVFKVSKLDLLYQFKFIRQHKMALKFAL